MAWIYLFIAGLLETTWAVGLKYTEGFTRLGASVFTLVTMAGSVWLLAVAMRTLPLGTAYAVWTGIGAVGAAIVGMAAFGEPRTAARIFCLSLIVIGIAGLRLVSAER
ncbi:MAG TPA: quaternary ammonium compound efflux SMR transporter SugE [Bryobacteraceae bacterium]|nr:quaternary ammonium compound efflux SMR transporter SugE [Bryobacteraceae bacterium]